MCYGLILGPEGLEPAQPRRILQCRLWHQADGYVAVPLSTICLLHGFIHASTSFVANGTNTAESRDCRRMCGARFQSWCNSSSVLLRIFVSSYLACSGPEISHCRSCHAHTAAAPRPSVTAASSKMTIQAKQNSLKREKTAERNRMYNKSRKSEITTRMKKVFVALEGFKASPPASEADLAPVQVLINEAFQVIDKAVVKGILHRNTADRRKARLSKARQIVLVESGLYKP